MNQPFSFTSKCPGCEYECVIERYSRGDLLRLLELGHPIEARCTECDVHWRIAPEMRIKIARAVLESFSSMKRRAP